MSILVATIDLILTPQGIVSPGSGSWSLVSFISQKNFAEGKSIMGGNDMMFTLVGWNAAGFIAGTVKSVGVVSIPKTAVKVLLEHGEFVMRLGDMGSVPMVGNLLVTGIPSFFSEPWIISDVGQTKVFAK